MSEKFEPYGELLPPSGPGEREAPKPGSAVLELVGRGLFWLLVVVIVATRIAYFSPASLFSTQANSANATPALTQTAQR
jgi:hypothetical protein